MDGYVSRENDRSNLILGNGMYICLGILSYLYPISKIHCLENFLLNKEERMGNGPDVKGAVWDLVCRVQVRFFWATQCECGIQACKICVSKSADVYVEAGGMEAAFQSF